MTKEELAQLLDGREYRSEMTPEEKGLAKEHGLVVVFGYSDDGMAFRGAVHDYVDCYGGGMAHITPDGLFESECDCEDCPYAKRERNEARLIEAVWGEGDWSWTYKTNIPHATFNIYEDGDPYCQGIVFKLDEVMVRQ